MLKRGDPAAVPCSVPPSSGFIVLIVLSTVSRTHQLYSDLTQLGSTKISPKQEVQLFVA